MLNTTARKNERERFTILITLEIWPEVNQFLATMILPSGVQSRVAPYRKICGKSPVGSGRRLPVPMRNAILMMLLAIVSSSAAAESVEVKLGEQNIEVGIQDLQIS